MSPLTQADALDIAAGNRVIDADGEQAEILSVDHGGAQPAVLLRTDKGRIVRVSADMLTMQDGECRLAFAFGLLADEQSPPMQNDASLAVESRAEGETVIPVYEEQLHVEKRKVDTGGVRVVKTVSQREQIVDVPLERDELEVVRVPVDRTLEAGEQPATRYEGDTLIVPVLEELLVVEKRWRLKEEVRITRHRREAHAAHSVVLRAEAVAVERFDEPRPGSSDPIG